ncbi:hypothetical protein M2323_002213 [Rhodoblastus acidophilus]|nr:hypothetical protein [Rhodoblastus acidophilus]MCW2284435.1 hypothetical protein [Rhodoblastus acidophilus]MCW2333282.1 hypothetical protein [Rhodoblastus acidophilus]
MVYLTFVNERTAGAGNGPRNGNLVGFVAPD